MSKADSFDHRTFKRMQMNESPKDKGKLRTAFIDSDSSSGTETYTKSVKQINDQAIDYHKINKVISSPAYMADQSRFSQSKNNPLQRRDTNNRRKSIMFIKGMTQSRIIEDIKSSEDEVNIDSLGEDNSVSGGDTYRDALTPIEGIPQLSEVQAQGEDQKLSQRDPRKNEINKEPILVFRRGSKFIQIWNGILVFCILLDLIIIPLEVCTLDVVYIGPWALSALNLVQLIYLIDIYVCFNKTYYTESVKEVTDKIDIGLRYFSSTAFFFDLLSCSPVLACFQIYMKPKGYNQLFLLIRFCKGFKLREILIEFHQQFYISSKVYFLGYLASVLIIVNL